MSNTGKEKKMEEQEKKAHLYDLSRTLSVDMYRRLCGRGESSVQSSDWGRLMVEMFSS